MSIIKDLNIVENSKNVLFIGGPTASGKTSLSVKIAHDFQANNQPVAIISADSRQIYTDMTICTAKPVERKLKQITSETFTEPILYEGIDHYLFDIRKPDQRYTLFDFQAQAKELIQQLHSKNYKVIVAGGTGLYIDSLINNYQISQSSEDQNIKSDLIKEFNNLHRTTNDEEAKEVMWQKLFTLNPEEASKIHKNNHHAVLRALEVLSLTSTSKSSLNSKSEPSFKYQLLVLDPPREKLYQQINSRCQEMFTQGLIEETKALLDSYSIDTPSMTSIGYREVQQYLKQDISLKEATEKFQQATRNYAKRQLTWFRRYKSNPYAKFIDPYEILL